MAQVTINPSDSVTSKTTSNTPIVAPSTSVGTLSPS